MRYSWETQTYNDATLIFPAVATYPSVSIPLYVTDYSVPRRTPAWHEIGSVPQYALGGLDPSVRAMFPGSPDPLQVSFQGYTITPLFGGLATPWKPTTTGYPSGTDLGLSFLSYPELIMAYTEGRMNMTSAGRPQRTDPSSFIDPYGNRYDNNLHILTFEAAFTPVPQKQTFSMTLFLEDSNAL